MGGGLVFPQRGSVAGVGELVRNPGGSRWLASLAVALAAVLLVPSSAGAAFPGAPGPIAYPRLILDEGPAEQGGLFAHGPRSRWQLTNHPADAEPSYSPNGRFVAFVGDRTQTVFPDARTGSHIYVMRSDGSEVRALTGGASLDSSPSFSPDGRQVVFDRGFGSSRFSHIFVIGLSNHGLRRLTRGPGRDRDPVFTPNGRHIVFVSNRDRDAPRDRTDIFAMRRNGTHMRVLVDGRRNEFDPDVSPDGRRLAFASNRGGGPNVFVARIDGSRVRQLTHSRRDCFLSACHTSPAWAPNGRHITLLSISRTGTDLEVMRSNGTRRRALDMARTDPGGFGTAIGAPAWGPRSR